MTTPLATADPAVYSAIRKETERQEYGLELIASENYVSEAVLEAQGSIFTNKYAEGYPGKRYYGGCIYMDEVETLAQERAKRLFACEALRFRCPWKAVEPMAPAGRPLLPCEKCALLLTSMMRERNDISAPQNLLRSCPSCRRRP